MRPASGPCCVNYENIYTASSCTVPPPPHKFEWNAFPNNARMENRIDLNLGMLVSTSVIYHIPDLLNGYDFYFWLRLSVNQQLE